LILLNKIVEVYRQRIRAQHQDQEQASSAQVTEMSELSDVSVDEEVNHKAAKKQKRAKG